ncbi:MAG: ComF family protein [Candidatus Omnitrophica bacterium]|nr:ComF family protein [Candidatus Omnitrophota bacterium]
MLGFSDEFNCYWRSLLRILYPAACALCRIPLVLEETYLCRTCILKIEPLKDPKCIKCAHPLPPYGTYKSLCSACRSARPYYDRGFALVPYEEPVKSIFHQIKFGKKLWLLKIFTKILHRFSKSIDLKNYELIVPVPLDRSRRRERGFNQAYVIAQMLKRSAQTSSIQISELLRKRRTLPQSQLRREERLSHLKGAFSLRKREGANGRQILLVDDIVTTGSTINECAKTLKENGAERVDFFAIARSEFT